MSDLTPPRSRHRYILELGRGGMGTVYLALSHGPGGFNKLKVVKVLNAELASEPEFLKMFLNEARLSARLNHPNIVQTNEVGVLGSEYFIEMEFLDGQSYDALNRRGMKSGGRVTLDTHVWIVTQVLAGLHYAHELRGTKDEPLNIVHRDISPHNVFVTYDGAVKVLDFGIAKAADTQGETRSGVVKGKARFMAPEQALKQVVDRRADVFAVGVMLWEAVCQRRMWHGLDDVEVFLKLAAYEIPKVKSVRADVPPELEAILERALAPSSDDRYPTAEAMQLELEAFLERTGSRARGRAVGKLVTELFADRRAAVKQAIDQQIEVANGEEKAGIQQPAIIPQLRENYGYQATQTAKTKDLPLRVGGDAGAAPTVPAPPSTSSSAAEDAPRPEGESSRTANAVYSNQLQPNQRRSSRTRWTVAGAALLATGALVFVSARNHAQAPAASPVASSAPCKTIADCRAAGPRLVCGAAGVCAPALDCITNAECSGKFGGKAVCRPTTGACTPIETDECKIVGDPKDYGDGTIWFGTMFALSRADAAEIGRVNERGVRVAWDDFDRVSRGLPPPGLVGPARHLGLVSCDDTKEPLKVAQHLVEDLGAQAILGFGSSDEALDLVPSYLIPKGILSIIVSNGSPLISAIPQPESGRLSWRTTLTALQTAPAAARLVSSTVEPLLRKQGAVTHGAAMRVAVIRKDTAIGIAVADAVSSGLTFNGKSVVENGHDYLEIVVSSDAKDADTRGISNLLAFAPNAVIYEGGDELVGRIIAPFEAARRASDPAPYYIGCDSIGGESLDAAIAAHPELRHRFFGMYAPLSTPTNLQFTLRYNEGAASPTPYAMTPGPAYDGFYVLAYATYLALLQGGDATPRGTVISKMIRKLEAPGPSIEVGRAHVPEAFERLRTAGQTDLVGASSSLDFDAKTGDVNADLVVSCVRPVPRSTAYEPVEIGLKYFALKEEWSGELKCP